MKYLALSTIIEPPVAKSGETILLAALSKG
jgi:hypothetical protein